MPVKKFIRDYLSFNRKERVGILSLLGLICLIYFLPVIVEKKKPFPIKESNLLAQYSDSLEKQTQEPEKYENHSISTHYEPKRLPDYTVGDLFEFDPNNLPESGWRKLGLNEKTSKTITNYTGKGGKFRSAEDLQKIWGMPEGFFERVRPYVRIEISDPKPERKEYVKTAGKTISIDINNSDTSQWIELPGIGSKLASRIINFREKLGGFYSVEQVKETFGLQDSVFQKIKPFLQIRGDVKKININTATKDQLKTHPYIKWNLANAIVEYRNQHGNFQSINELKKVSLITEEVAVKLQSYLEF